METNWNFPVLQALIDNHVEESSTLEYKRALALENTDKKKLEITKDVSAMANSNGGVIIYGIAEEGHLPTNLDPVDRSNHSKEWLEQIIGNIQPKISDCPIIPIDIPGDPNHGFYVVVIPKGSTVYQAMDKRYYRRQNFRCIPMEDYEIRELMNGGKFPEVDVELSFTQLKNSADHNYRLQIVVANTGEKMVNHFQLELNFAQNLKQLLLISWDTSKIEYQTTDKLYRLFYRSKERVLFPGQVLDISLDYKFVYSISNEAFYFLQGVSSKPDSTRNINLGWSLFADNMPKKEGFKSFNLLNNY